MSLSVLISDPDSNWADEVESFLKQKFYSSEQAMNGKDCQLKVYNGNFHAVILDFHTTNHSSLEVLKYLRLNAAGVKVILTVPNKKVFHDVGVSEEEVRKLGASDILVKPFSLETLVESIEGASQFETWKEIKEATGTPQAEEEVSGTDDEFTKIKVRDFYSGNTNIFDCYIRLGENKYIKVLHKGDFFESERLEKYTKKKEITHLYFKTKERAKYINFINKILSKLVDSKTAPTEKKVHTTKNVIEKFVEEVYTTGLKPQLIEEGKQICENMYRLVQKDPDLASLMARYEEYDPPAYAHLFLVSFVSAITCQNLEWSSRRTVQLITLGALLHDIGRLKLPPELTELPASLMNKNQLELYQQHPKFGAEMLQKYPLITEPVRQIVYQHHEYATGEGFPNGLTGFRMYPLAKVVSLANEFSSIIVENKITPLEGLRKMIPDKELILRFDPDVVKALVKGFITNKK